MKGPLIPAPVVLFVYKRIDTLDITVKALQRNFMAMQSDLYIFSDAAKTERDKPTVQAVRTYIKSLDGFKSITIVESSHNRGLASSIIAGVSTVLKKHEQAIVLEDDLQTTPNFLTYMNASLEQYRSNRQVFSISGYAFDLGVCPSETADAYFLNRGWSWGWATWQDRWKQVDWTVNTYTNFAYDMAARRRFSLGGSDLNKMLDDQMAGKIDSWAIRWFYHQFCTGGLTLYPVLSKVYNNGFDSNATHTSGSNRRYLPKLDEVASEIFVLPESARIVPYYQRKFQEKMGYLSRIISKVQTLLMNFSSLSRY